LLNSSFSYQTLVINGFDEEVKSVTLADFVCFAFFLWLLVCYIVVVAAACCFVIGGGVLLITIF